jgi:hypothetical protein
LWLTAAACFAQRDVTRRDRVLAAIEQAQEYLIEQQGGNGAWASDLNPHSVGINSLAILALINSGMTPEDPPVANGLRWLRGQPDPTQTYDTSLMIMALAAAKDSIDDLRIGSLADLLETSQVITGDTGAWSYTAGANWWDNSNTQFAVLGLREAAHAGAVIDRGVLQRARQHWLDCQQGDRAPGRAAGWNYMGDQGGTISGSMTVAGIASMTVLEELLHDDRRDTFDGEIDCCLTLDPTEGEQSIEAGVRWLGHHFSATTNPGDQIWYLYYMYGLERAGRFTGTRNFYDINDRPHDWYREGADHLITNQNPRDGSWQSFSESDPIVGTSLALLFLSKGIAPVLINKIEFGPRLGTGEADESVWNIHRRDAANLTEFITTLDKWPRTLNWQTLDLETAALQRDGITEAMQAPILYLSGQDDLSDIYNSPEQVQLLTEAIQQGAFLFAVATCDDTSADFLDEFDTLVQRMFPNNEYQLKPLPDTHDIYRSEYFLGPDPPELYGVDFGCRTAIVLSLEPHGCKWNKWLRVSPPGRHQNVQTSITRSLRVAVNVIAYATGRELHDRLETPEILLQLDENHIAQGRLAIARLRHTGGWDAAPNAHRHLLVALQNTLGLQPSVEAPTIPATDPELFDYPILYMHGRKNYQLTDEELQKLREYLQNGGVLVADACCGAPQFDDSFRDMVNLLLEQELERIPIDHEIYNHPVGHDIREVHRRIPSEDAQSALTVEESVGEPILEGVQIDGRYAIIYSKYDLSCALEQQATSACAGYLSADAARIAVNIVVYALYQ